MEIAQKSRRGTFEKVLELLDRHGIRGAALDIPAGYGKLACELQRRGYTVQAADLELPEDHQGLLWTCADLDQTLPFEGEQFDLVVCSDGIEHVENPFHTVREFERILKPGGCLVISTPNYLNIEKRLKFLLTGRHTKPLRVPLRKAGMAKADPGHINPLTVPRLEDVLKMAGLRVVEVDSAISKPKQALLWPLAALIQLPGWARSSKRRKDYNLATVNSNRILLGGHQLLVLAQKR